MRPKRSWVPRALVALTLLACVTVGVATFPTWWARRIASDLRQDTVAWDSHRYQHVGGVFTTRGTRWDPLDTWECTTWRDTFGNKELNHRFGRLWLPRRVHYEFLLQVTGADLPEDPAAWETWINDHRNFVWDDRQKRLVEPKS